VPYRNAAPDEIKIADEEELASFQRDLQKKRWQVRAFVFGSAAVSVLGLGVLTYSVIVTPPSRRGHDPCHEVYAFAAHPSGDGRWIKSVEIVCDDDKDEDEDKDEK